MNSELLRQIISLKKSGKKNKEIAESLNIDLITVCNNLKSGYEERLKRMKEKEERERDFEDLVKELLPYSNSYNNLCENLGLKGVDYYIEKVKKIIKKYNLSTEHFGTLYVNSLNNKKIGVKINNEEYFVNGIKRNGVASIKKLIASNIKEYKCECCGITEWNGKPLTLQIHHMNGDHSDNRIENLQILCPNCHTQTDTYGTKNGVKRKNTIPKKVNDLIKQKKNGTINKVIEKIRKKVITVRSKEKKYCKVCGKEIETKYGDTYCSPECLSKSQRKFEVTEEQLINDFKELKSFTAVGRKYGVSDNAVKKRSKKLGIYDEIRKYITAR